MIRALTLAPREFFLLGARFSFGFWILYVGLMKLVNGPAGFIAHLTDTFAETWVPGILVLLLAWIIIVAEVLLGLWLLLGKHQRLAWIGTAVLMFTLTFGMTILAKHDVVANNWQYFILALGCAAFTKPDK